MLEKEILHSINNVQLQTQATTQHLYHIMYSINNCEDFVFFFERKCFKQIFGPLVCIHQQRKTLKYNR